MAADRIGIERWGVAFITGFSFLALSALATWLFNPWWANPLQLMPSEQLWRRLKDSGLISTRTYQARRAFEVQEYDDEGIHYFVELADGKILFPSGQYLYDYAPIEDDPEVNQPRSFPCTEFSVHRHKTEGYVMDLECRGTVIEPEFLAAPFPQQKKWPQRPLEDGQVIFDISYDDLKALMVEP
jgi:hypothetical protein